MRKVEKIALMAVGDDGWQGGIQYIINILGALNAVGDEAKIELHLFKGPSQKFNEVNKFTNIDIKVRDLKDALASMSFPNRVQWSLQRRLGKRIYPRMENYLLENEFDYVFPATLSDCGNRLNSGSWIADFQYKHFPDGANKRVNEEADRHISHIAHATSKIILSSKFCESDCHRFFPVTEGKTHVMPFAVYLDKSNLEFRDFEPVREKYVLPEKFLMVSNLFAPTKNHKTLFQALGLLKAKGTIVHVVCTGNIVDYRNESYANEILQSLTDNKIRSQVHLLGLIPRKDQLALYRMAFAMVQPSVNEGWSTLVEEAKALGKDLLLSDIEVHREQYPDNNYFFEPMNAQDLADKIEQVLRKGENLSFPDIGTENRAFALYEEKVRQFGRRFLEIARL